LPKQNSSEGQQWSPQSLEFLVEAEAGNLYIKIPELQKEAAIHYPPHSLIWKAPPAPSLAPPTPTSTTPSVQVLVGIPVGMC